MKCDYLTMAPNKPNQTKHFVSKAHKGFRSCLLFNLIEITRPGHLRVGHVVKWYETIKACNICLRQRIFIPSSTEFARAHYVQCEGTFCTRPGAGNSTVCLVSQPQSLRLSGLRHVANSFHNELLILKGDSGGPVFGRVKESRHEGKANE